MNAKRKYELTEETKTLDGGTVLHRIRAVIDFTLSDSTKVQAGDLGGWIESEDNLPHDGKAWVFDEACVYDDALVGGNAEVYGKAKVFGKAQVCGGAEIFDNAQVHDEAFVSGFVRIFGNARVYGGAEVFGNSEVRGNAKVHDKARVFGGSLVGDEAEVSDDAWVYDAASVCGEARVSGCAQVCGSADVCGDAKVGDGHGYATYKNTWSSGRWFTYTSSNGKWKVGCFYGTGEELVAKAYRDGVLCGRCYAAIVSAQEAIDDAKKQEQKQKEMK